MASRGKGKGRRDKISKKHNNSPKAPSTKREQRKKIAEASRIPTWVEKLNNEMTRKAEKIDGIKR